MSRGIKKNLPGKKVKRRPGYIYNQERFVFINFFHLVSSFRSRKMRHKAVWVLHLKPRTLVSSWKYFYVPSLYCSFEWSFPCIYWAICIHSFLYVNFFFFFWKGEQSTQIRELNATIHDLEQAVQDLVSSFPNCVQKFSFFDSVPSSFHLYRYS